MTKLDRALLIFCLLAVSYFIIRLAMAGPTR